MIRDLVAAFAALAVATVVAELLGAANLGTALTFGVIAFMATIVGRILIRGPEHTPPAEAVTDPEQRKRPKPSGRPRA